ncbi:MAG: hypothetical protein LBP35_01720 [Candidatus Ancillula trichonymphae]|nr:hypothetical protein [Candidatus Ancillula trichonymphae]
MHCLTGIIGVDSGEIVFYDSGVESAGAQTGVDLDEANWIMSARFCDARSLVLSSSFRNLFLNSPHT